MHGQNWVLRYLPQSLPQIPVAATRNSPASGGISGSGSSRNSVWRGLVITAARVDFALIRWPVRSAPFFRRKPRRTKKSLPGVDRDVDHVRLALAADRLQRPVDLLETEGVGDCLLQREAVRGELLQRELARLVGVAARALHRRVFLGHAVDREVREVGHLIALDDKDARLALERGDAEQHGCGARARRAVD